MGKQGTNLSRSRQHAFAGVEPSAASILNFLDFCALFPNNRAHARIGYHELDGNCTAARNRRNVEWLVVYPSDNEPKCLRIVNTYLDTL